MEGGLRTSITQVGDVRTVRVIIFQWHPSTDGSPNPFPLMLDILALPSTPFGSYTTAPYNWDNRQNYSILYDRTHTLCVFDNNSVPVNVDIFPGKPGHGQKKILYAGDSVEGSNKFYILYCGDITAASSVIKYSRNLYYTDV